METTPTNGLQKHRGSCHCGAVRFEIEADLRMGASRCNCSICTKLNPTGFVVKPDKFTLLASDEGLGEYRWGGNISCRYFCRRCFVYTFARGHLAEVGGDYVSVNLNTLDGVDLREVNVVHWDGRHDNWDAGPRDQPWPLAEAA
jgi:hypothetical protein